MVGDTREDNRRIPRVGLTLNRLQRVHHRSGRPSRPWKRDCWSHMLGMHSHAPPQIVAPRPEPHEIGSGASLTFLRPPFRRTVHGVIRRVGVEVEFQGISAKNAARALAVELGGTCREEDPHAFHILDTAIGRLAVELDLRYAHPRRSEATPRVRLGPAQAAWLGTALGAFVPRELVTAPLPIDELDCVDRAVGVLRAAGARGSGATWFGSLGLHFNIDPPSLDAETLTAVLKAFLLLNARLRRETTAPTASAAFLPKPYPDAYVRRVVAPDYWPDRSTLAEDYLAANPTRNRDLDLLPLFLHLNPAQVRARLPYEKIGSRAVFHYRLPRAYVADPAWSIAAAWNGWIAVETLAGDRERLNELGREACRLGDTVRAPSPRWSLW